MSYQPNRLLQVATAALLTITIGAPVWADDTEIFFGSPSTTLRPNVLFVIDTSGSMDTMVNVRPPYAPATTYTGSCASTAIYWKKKSSKGSGSTDSTPPSCSSNTRYINTASFLCQTARADLNSLGARTIGPVNQWHSGDKKWEDLDDVDSQSAYVECKDDSEIDHGLVANDNKIPANGTNGPYTTSAALGASWKDANTYFFYTGNYLNYYNNTSTSSTKSRLQIVQDAANKVIDSSNLNNTNVALMRFSANAEGGMVIYPFTPVETARGTGGIHAQINGLTANGYTPLSETLYEAYQFLVGGSLVFGNSSTPVTSVATSRKPTDSTSYRRTIDQSCEQTYVIYLTDGEPTQDTSAESAIESASLLNGQCDGGTNADGVCLDDLAGYMHTTDLYNDPLLTGTSEQPETATTYTIGFGDNVPAAAQQLLADTATEGGGENFTATDDATLTEAFASIAAEIDSIDVTFTSPTVSVNAFNRTRTLDDLFFSVFQPSREYHWPGNLKKYRLNAGGTLEDATATSAIDLSTGFFKTTSRSFWSAAPDGEKVVNGGAANLLSATRTVYTYSGTSLNLTDTTNAVVDANTTAITNAALGLPATATATQRTNLISWIRGTDIANLSTTPTTPTARLEMGDPLHAQPGSVIYGKDASNNPIGVIYTATNDGYLHAISASDGSELWSFVPQELLTRMSDLFANAISTNKGYGLDGNISVYRFDNDGDGTIETGSPDNDRVYLIFGMGRGGRDYYALDVSDRTAPKMLWRNGSTGTLTGLGETWSTPVITDISYVAPSGTLTKKKVAIFAGGYDPTQDGGAALPAVQAEYHTDTIGNHIYIVDVVTGTLLWRADGCTSCSVSSSMVSSVGVWKHPKLLNSIPADMRVIDMNDDGLADRMYTADTGGRVWRFDIINGQTLDNLVRGGVFASLGFASGIGTNPADARRFYTPPDASLLRVDNSTFVNLVIGSGFRGHPLNTNIEDRIYSLRDSIPFRAMTLAEYTTMDAAPIVDNPSAATPQLVDVTTTLSPTIPATAKGWKINLAAGEKVLVEAQTFAGSVLLPTYSTTGTSTTFSCSARTGTNRLYSLRTLDGSPATDQDQNNITALSDRSVVLRQQGIAPSAVMLFPSASSPTAPPPPPTPPAACNPAVDPACVPCNPATDPFRCVPPCDPATDPNQCRRPPDECENGMKPPTVVAYIGAEKVPQSFKNCPAKTFWRQKNVD